MFGQTPELVFVILHGVFRDLEDNVIAFDRSLTLVWHRAEWAVANDHIFIREHPYDREFVPPPGSRKVDSNDPNFEIFREVRQDGRTFAVRLLFVNVSGLLIDKFDVKYSVPSGWRLEVDHQASMLGPEQTVLTQVIHLENAEGQRFVRNSVLGVKLECRSGFQQFAMKKWTIVPLD
jgi:hypothetical protein